MRKLKIVSIGSGNVATHLVQAIHKKKHNIVQVWSRKLSNAKKLASKVNAEYTAGKTKIYPNADLYIVCLPDSEIQKVFKWLPFSLTKDQTIIHTSGSIKSFPKGHGNNGVLYPLQSFNKARKLDFKKVPVFVNANNEETTKLLTYLAKQLSKKVIFMNDEHRKELHLSAVILNNFINHLAYKSEAYLESNNLRFDYLSALLDNTFEKIKEGKLFDQQTGPARRKDKSVIKDHLKMLDDDQHLKQIYKSISESIIKTYQ